MTARQRDRLLVAAAAIIISICAWAFGASAAETTDLESELLTTGSATLIMREAIADRPLPRGVRFDAKSGKYLDDIRFLGWLTVAMPVLAMAYEFAFDDGVSMQELGALSFPLVIGFGEVFAAEHVAELKMKGRENASTGN